MASKRITSPSETFNDLTELPSATDTLASMVQNMKESQKLFQKNITELPRHHKVISDFRDGLSTTKAIKGSSLKKFTDSYTKLYNITVDGFKYNNELTELWEATYEQKNQAESNYRKERYEHQLTKLQLDQTLIKLAHDKSRYETELNETADIIKNLDAISSSVPETVRDAEMKLKCAQLRYSAFSNEIDMLMEEARRERQRHADYIKHCLYRYSIVQEELNTSLVSTQVIKEELGQRITETQINQNLYQPEVTAYSSTPKSEIITTSCNLQNNQPVSTRPNNLNRQLSIHQPEISQHQEVASLCEPKAATSPILSQNTELKQTPSTSKTYNFPQASVALNKLAEETTSSKNGAISDIDEGPDHTPEMINEAKKADVSLCTVGGVWVWNDINKATWKRKGMTIRSCQVLLPSTLYGFKVVVYLLRRHGTTPASIEIKIELFPDFYNKRIAANLPINIEINATFINSLNGISIASGSGNFSFRSIGQIAVGCNEIPSSNITDDIVPQIQFRFKRIDKF